MTHTFAQILSLTLQEMRRDHGLSQKELARLSGVGEKTISTYETGVRIDRIKVDHLDRIARVLGTTASELLVAVERAATITDRERAA